MKRLAVCLALLCASTLHAQTSESIDVRIVNVDVTVTSKGAPVTGLTRDDFEIFEDGKQQKITNFYASETKAAVTASATPANAAPAPAAAAEPEQDPRFRRK